MIVIVPILFVQRWKMCEPSRYYSILRSEYATFSLSMLLVLGTVSSYYKDKLTPTGPIIYKDTGYIIIVPLPANACDIIISRQPKLPAA